jgi:hypothetical protein
LRKRLMGLKGRGRNRSAQAHAVVFLASLLLVQGMTASSLLVWCLPGDGTCLIELLGSDPCRFHTAAADAKDACDHSPPLLGEGNAEKGSCVDMSMDYFSVNVAVVSLHAPSASPVGVPDAAAGISRGLQNPATLPVLFRLAREPVITADLDFPLPLSLRI